MCNISIKELINNNHTIICDTNVLLRIYDYSPEFADFAIKCLDSVSECLFLTYTTFLEYKKHYMSKYASAKNKLFTYNKRLDEITDKYSNDISKEFERIQQYRFPDTDLLCNSAKDKINELKKIFDDYYDNHELLVAVNDEYLKNDPIKAFVDSIQHQVLSPYGIERVYDICDDGEKRFKNSQPPGFKDKSKDGIRQYSDLILWNEVLDFSSKNGKNIIFVTDDVKTDWWESQTDENGNVNKCFHSQLVSEFERKTNNKILAFTSKEFFSCISTDSGIEMPDTVNLALNQTIDKYVNSIGYRAFEKIEDKLAYSQNEYLDESTADIGSEGLSEFEIESYDILEYSLIERNDKEMVYCIKYNVSLSATSCEYWGRDDDTKEIITSPDNQHVFEGTIELQVTRVLDDFVDLLYDNDFDEVIMSSGELCQTKFISGMVDDFESAENYCPKCGKPMLFENDSLNGFCVDCTQKYDV